MNDINSSNRKLSQNLAGLFAFDLVAQHGNFTTAAEVLGLTQSALSQRVKGLEIELGTALFKREHRGVTLTNEGLRLLGIVGPAMKQMGGAVNSFLERKSNPRVRISADFAFSTFWLLPRLSHLRTELGDEIEIQILASQIPPDDRDDCDITIHVAPMSFKREDDVLLLKEQVAAVCSPGFLAGAGDLSATEKLLDTQLLSLSRPPSAQWQTWQGWFSRLGITDERSRNYMSFNNYDMVVQSAIAGDGVALGWLGLVDDLLNKGLLVRATEDVVLSNAGYIMSRNYSNGREGPERVFDWISKQAKENME